MLFKLHVVFISKAFCCELRVGRSMRPVTRNSHQMPKLTLFPDGIHFILGIVRSKPLFRLNL